MSGPRRIAPLLLAILSATTLLASDRPPLPPRDLFEATARASGLLGPEEIGRYRAGFDRLAGEVGERVAGIGSERKRARRMMEFLYARTFRSYREDADGIHDVLDRGEYNCVSGTLLSGLIARSLGLEARVLAGPRHLVLRLRLDGRERDVDATTGRRPALFGVPPLSPDENDSPFWLGPGARRVRTVELEEAVAFVWHNRGQRALERGAGLEAAKAFREAWRLHPDLGDDAEGLASALARAFRLEYESRAFASALDVAAIDLSIFPERTTAADRLQAAALKRVEALSDEGSLRSAEEVLDRSLGLLVVGDDRARLERAGCPIVARAAVRSEDWPLAFRMADRFALAEPDAVEGRRLIAWVDRRLRDTRGSPPAGMCARGDPESDGDYGDPSLP